MTFQPYRSELFVVGLLVSLTEMILSVVKISDYVAKVTIFLLIGKYFYDIFIMGG